MRSSKNARGADRMARVGAGRRLFAAAAILGVALASEAQTPRTGAGDRGTDLRMRETEILGERGSPNVLFVIPGGGGSPLLGPRLRDYRSEIKAPVVKPWLEADLRLSPPKPPPGPGLDFDWRKALREGGP